jgi:sulfate/thiosulfate transport system ATP-binding protein
MSIAVRHVRKQFGAFRALDGVSLDIPTGGLVALIGPSGSGKTTLLRIIAGLEAPDAGAILFDEADATHQRARDRRVGFVFQHYALFRHMTVFENVAFGLRVRPRRVRPSQHEIRARVGELLELVQLQPLGDRYPAQLSGGQRQRVALARALAIEPRVLLLDEPFGSLDAKVRRELRRWLRRFHDDLRITTVFVTHDQEEALEVADHVAVMHAGRIEQFATPAAIYDEPATPFVYEFLGGATRFHGQVSGGRARVGGIELDAPEHGDAERRPAVAYARPHEIEVEREGNGHAVIPAVVQHVLAVGPLVRIELEAVEDGAGRDLIEVELPKERYRALDLRVGDRVFVGPRALRLFVD